jgi:hypothetical protein
VVYSDCRVTVRHVVRARWRPTQAVKLRVQLTSGPRLHFIISKILNHQKIEIRIGDLPDVQNLANFGGQ